MKPYPVWAIWIPRERAQQHPNEGLALGDLLGSLWPVSVGPRCPFKGSFKGDSSSVPGWPSLGNSNDNCSRVRSKAQLQVVLKSHEPPSIFINQLAWTEREDARIIIHADHCMHSSCKVLAHPEGPDAVRSRK